MEWDSHFLSPLGLLELLQDLVRHRGESLTSKIFAAKIVKVSILEERYAYHPTTCLNPCQIQRNSTYGGEVIAAVTGQGPMCFYVYVVRCDSILTLRRTETRVIIHLA